MLMTYGDKDHVVVEQACPFCGAVCEAMLNTAEFEAWRGGKLIQYAMPTTPETTREWLISGICPDCQDFIFENEEV